MRAWRGRRRSFRSGTFSTERKQTATGPSLETTTYVGSYDANAWGLHDMHGNVLEWCSDWYGDYSSASSSDPTGATTGDYRVNRGGSWVDLAQGCRSAYRDRRSPDFRGNYLGFRPALVPSVR